MGEDLRALETELQAELEAVRAAKDAREDARRAAVLKDEIAAARRQAREEAKLAELEAEHGLLGKSLARIDTIDGMIVVKRADGIKVRKWQDEHADNVTSDALRQLARPCVVYPELGDFDAIAAERPIVIVNVATEVLRLAGLKLKEQGSK